MCVNVAAILTDPHPWFLLCDRHLSARVADADRETLIIDYFKANYIEPGVGGTRQALASLCLNSYSSRPVGNSGEIGSVLRHGFRAD
jgi:hypothetical protein